MPINDHADEEKTNITEAAKNRLLILRKILPIVAFAIPFLVLYCLDPNSFEQTWKGRTYYLFFLWLVLLETILNWEELKADRKNVRTFKNIPLAITLLSPTIYVAITWYLGLNTRIIDFASGHGILPFVVDFMPLSTEYLVFAVLFALIILMGYGIDGLQNYSLSTIFLSLIGFIYTVDNLYPLGGFTPFQAIVPTTTTLAANVLNLMGYQTSIFTMASAGYGWIPFLYAQGSRGSATFGVGWPCAGVESLLIYTVTILLFLSKSAIPRLQRAVYFVVGALVTYFINILRIVTIFVIQINEGDLARQRFHDYYGQLYSIVWIVSFPLIIIGSRALWTKVRNWRTAQTKPMLDQFQPSQPSPA
jgi:thaumarchaeosortase